MQEQHPPNDPRQYMLVANEIKALSSHIQPPVPNPAPLGLFAFGFTTALLQIKHTGLGGDSVEENEGTENFVLGFAMFFGGLLQIIAGLSEIRRNNLFGYTAFLAYGGFWMSMSLVDIIQLLAPNGAAAPNPIAVETMLYLLGSFTFVLWICTFKLNITINVLFMFLMIFIFLLAGGVRNTMVDTVAGYMGFITSALAYWLAAAELWNDIHFGGKEEIPLGHYSHNPFSSHGGMHFPGQIQGASLGLRRMFHHSNEDTSRPNEKEVAEVNGKDGDIEVGMA